MTTFGKTLAFLTLVLSLGMATWAWALWANRIDWGKGTPEQVGEFARYDAELTTLMAGEPPAEAAWRGAAAEVRAEEARLAAARDFYRVQLEHLLTRASAADPARRVVLADQDDPAHGLKKGQVAVDPRTGLPRMEPVKEVTREGEVPLQSLASYDAELERLREERLALEGRHKKQIDEAVALTNQLTGPKGLVQRLIDERRKQTDLKDELETVYQQVVNNTVEGELVTKRAATLRRRVEELKHTGVASRD
jgi:hypothetical protein